jgi:hypothetical protein
MDDTPAETGPVLLELDAETMAAFEQYASEHHEDRHEALQTLLDEWLDGET